MACTNASVSYRAILSEDELVRILVTGELPLGKRPHLITLLEEAPVALLEGMAEDVERRCENDKVRRNVLALAESLGLSQRTRSWLKET